MRFNIVGNLTKDNSFVFSSYTYYVPRQNEEIEINGVVYVVQYVRYKIVGGTVYEQDVQLGLALK